MISKTKETPCRKNKEKPKLQRHAVVVITTAQLHLTKSELRFCTDSNPACGVSKICNGENL